MKHRHPLLIATVLFGLLFGSASCTGTVAPAVTKSSFDRVTIGMTKDEVEEILGSESWYAEAQIYVWTGAKGEAIIDFHAPDGGHSRVREKRWTDY